MQYITLKYLRNGPPILDEKLSKKQLRNSSSVVSLSSITIFRGNPERENVISGISFQLENEY